MKKEEYDVIILGAGPAGLKCAETLGDSKLKVLLLEQKQVIGPKICAGGLTALNSSFKLPLSKSLEFKTQHVIINNKEIEEIELENPIYIIDRYELGKFQLERINKNIKIQKNTTVKEITEDFVLTEKGDKFYYKKLVGADGSSSIVRRYLNLKNKIYLGMQYIIPKKHKKLVWFINPKLLGSGYCWIFPHKTFTSAGVFFNPKHISSEKAKEGLNKLLEDYGMSYKNSKFEGAPINCLFKGFQFGNIFLIGDAAGLVSANTGEGISYALSSGYDIAKYILNPDYKLKNIKNLLKYKRRQEFLLGILDRMPRIIQDVLFSIFFKVIRNPSVQHYLGY